MASYPRFSLARPSRRHYGAVIVEHTHDGLCVSRIRLYGDNSPDTKSDVIGDLPHDYRTHNSLHGRNAATAIDIYNNLLAHY